MNRRAAKDTLRRVWGLGEGIQILEVGLNLFQFKFQFEFELDQILRGVLWSSDNQLLMLCQWKKGMCTSSVFHENASQWVQIWGAPFDMRSPKVANDVGARLGVVEDVET